MAGLQGSGKTTACAKLAKLLGDDRKKVGLAACDTQRPAAVEQLVTMGKRSGATVYEQRHGAAIRSRSPSGRSTRPAPTGSTC